MLENEYDISLKTCEISSRGVAIADYKKLLKRYVSELSHDVTIFNNTPLMISLNQDEVYSKLIKLLYTTLEKIVSNYFLDERIRQIYQLDTKLEEILKLANVASYEVGMYRPDIIFDETGQAKICEIGCRYPINGWMLSYYLSKILKELSQADTDWKPIDKQLDFISEIFKDFSKDEKLFYVHNKEKGTEAFLLFEELKKKGLLIEDISPSELTLYKEELYVDNDKAVQFILELDREELKEIDTNILSALIKSEKCINDLRTIILVHDKRVLSVLYDEEIMLDYISMSEYNFLKAFLIPSFILDTSAKREKFSNSNQNWVLKRSSGGRGVDMYVKDECATDIWQQVIRDEWKDYMIQEFVEQQKVAVTHKGLQQKLNIVGMLLSYNEISFGTGLYRGAIKSIINVHSGACILPSAIKK
ncbi:magnesium transporter [Tenacibaculum amylolyticum]|uniref:hypothetical protein n=1 Tax=Tenacibaculum amylolyticum TaxID=104269 RepID=UPI003895F6E3